MLTGRQLRNCVDYCVHARVDRWASSPSSRPLADWWTSESFHWTNLINGQYKSKLIKWSNGESIKNGRSKKGNWPELLVLCTTCTWACTWNGRVVGWFIVGCHCSQFPYKRLRIQLENESIIIIAMKIQEQSVWKVKYCARRHQCTHASSNSKHCA